MLVEIFDGIRDPRKIDRVTYELGDLLAVALLTYLCGGVDYQDMHIFAKYRADEFGLFPDTPKRPSADVFEDIFAFIKTDYVERCVLEHGKRVLDVMNEKQIAIDGKKQCGTAPKEKGPKGDYLLHAFVAENSLFVGQEKLKDKENEIPAIPRLIDGLEITGATLSIDAIGTQVDIAEKIVDCGGHYFLAVKDNQPGLLTEIKDVMKYNNPMSTDTETDKDHARVETRSVAIYPASMMEDKEVLARWKNLTTLVRIDTRTVHVSENCREESQTRYYISDEDFPHAKYFGGLARSHWAVENGLHWHLDVTFKEDACRARKKNAAQNLSLLRKLALQIAKATNDKRSVRKRLQCASWNPEYLFNLLKNYGF